MRESISGVHTLDAIQVGELGTIDGLRGIHLQCGVGIDTLALARLGARMTALDISGEACTVARSSAAAAGLKIDVFRGDVLLPTDLPEGQFDFVYTSNGVLRWLPNLQQWARNVAELLLPNAWLYLFEIHPLVYRLSNARTGHVELIGDYFAETPSVKQVSTTHVGPADNMANRRVVHTDWTVASVFQALIQAGLRIDMFNEHRVCPYSRKDLLDAQSDGHWGLEQTPIPLAFSIRARKAG